MKAINSSKSIITNVLRLIKVSALVGLFLFIFVKKIITVETATLVVCNL